MDKVITYTNRYGESIRLAPDTAYHIKGTDLHDRQWSYTTLNGTITSMKRKTREYSLSVYMRGGDLAARDALCDVFEADTMANVDGTIEWGGWSMRCRAYASAKDGWWFDDGVLHDEVKIVSSQPVWSRDVESHYYAKNASTADASMESGYPKAYPHGYLSSSTGSTVDNATAGDADFRLRIFGPCASPYVIIGNNRYELDVTLSVGERAAIDTRDKTAVKVDSDGTETSVYAYLKMGMQNSGSYAFQKLPRGSSTIVWDGTFAFDIVVHEERSEPKWS